MIPSNYPDYATVTQNYSELKSSGHRDDNDLLCLIAASLTTIAEQLDRLNENIERRG